MEKLIKLLSIDLAPKDGSEVVCWCPNIGWRTLCYEHKSKEWINASYRLFDYEPTHFVSLKDFESELP